MIGLILAVTVAAATPSDKATNVAFVCMMRRVGDAAQREFNFGVLLSAEPRSANEPSVRVIETIDNLNALSGKPIDVFYGTGEGRFAGLNGPSGDPATVMLSLSKSVRGPWLDAGTVHYGGKNPEFSGPCFGLKTADTAADFHARLNKGRPTQ